MMAVKLLNSISFENKTLKLIKEPEKVTYKYLNTNTKKNRLDNVSKFWEGFYRK